MLSYGLAMVHPGLLYQITWVCVDSTLALQRNEFYMKWLGHVNNFSSFEGLVVQYFVDLHPNVYTYTLLNDILGLLLALYPDSKNGCDHCEDYKTMSRSWMAPVMAYSQTVSNDLTMLSSAKRSCSEVYAVNTLLLIAKRFVLIWCRVMDCFYSL